MRILKQYEGGEAKPATYVRSDMQPVEGATDDVKWYIVEETERPTINEFEIIRTSNELTTEANEDYPHFFKAIEVHTVSQISNDDIINMLDDSLGTHLDTNYPIWKRQKHLSELIEGVTGERLQYIENLKAWESNCRAERDLRESELINNNKLPSLIWDEVPQN